MLGAIIGDIAGSRFEFDPTNDYNFEIFAAGSDYTDDTICTVAVMDAILHDQDFGEMGDALSLESVREDEERDAELDDSENMDTDA